MGEVVEFLLEDYTTVQIKVRGASSRRWRFLFEGSAVSFIISHKGNTRKRDVKHCVKRKRKL